MDSVSNNDVKIPKPQFEKDKTAQKTTSNPVTRLFNRPNLGVINPPDISKTPISDSFQRRKEQNPFTKYKLTFNTKYKEGFKLRSVSSIGIVLLGICSLIFKGKKPPVKP